MTIIKGIDLYSTGLLLALFIFNLLLGDGRYSVNGSIIFLFNVSPFLISLLVLVTTFVSSLDIERKKKIMWLAIPILLLCEILLLFYYYNIGALSREGGGGGYVFLGRMIYGGLGVVTVVIVSIFLRILLRLEERRQNIIIFCIFIVFLFLNILQWFGIFRPGFIE